MSQTTTNGPTTRDRLAKTLEVIEEIAGTYGRPLPWADARGRAAIAHDLELMARFDDLSSTPVSVYTGGEVEEPFYQSYREFNRLAGAAEVTVPAVAAEEPLRSQARAFIEAIERGAAGVVSGERGADVVSVLEAINASIRTGGAPVPVKAWKGPSAAP